MNLCMQKQANAEVRSQRDPNPVKRRSSPKALAKHALDTLVSSALQYLNKRKGMWAGESVITPVFS